MTRPTSNDLTRGETHLQNSDASSLLVGTWRAAASSFGFFGYPKARGPIIARYQDSVEFVSGRSTANINHYSTDPEIEC